VARGDVRAAAAIGFAFTAALTKVVTDYIASDWVSMFSHWQTYALAVTGVAALFLAQNAFHAGPIAASQSTLIMVDPLVSILIGIVLFGDQLRTHGAWARSRRSRSSCCSPASASCATRRSWPA